MRNIFRHLSGDAWRTAKTRDKKQTETEAEMETETDTGNVSRTAANQGKETETETETETDRDRDRDREGDRDISNETIAAFKARMRRTAFHLYFSSRPFTLSRGRAYRETSTVRIVCVSIA